MVSMVTAVTFLEYWKRKNASLAHHWDCLDFEDEEVRILFVKVRWYEKKLDFARMSSIGLYNMFFFYNTDS